MDTLQPSWEPSWRPEESGTQVCLVAWLWWCTHSLQVVRHQHTDLGGQAVPTTTSLPDIRRPCISSEPSILHTFDEAYTRLKHRAVQ